MNKRLERMPVYQRLTGQIDPDLYHDIRVAMLRLHPPIRLILEGLRTLDLILEDDAWIVVDRRLNDVPVVAWTDFQAHARSALHEPMPCTILRYHQHAHMIEARVLEFASKKLTELMHEKKHRS